jgi:endosialidase-like protein
MKTSVRFDRETHVGILIILLVFSFIGLVPKAQSQAVFGNGNTGVGHRALESVTDGENNTAVGAAALSEDRSGSRNTASGQWALRSNTTGNDNVADGKSALRENTAGFQNTAAGLRAMEGNTTGDQSTAVGAFALRKVTSSRFNTAIGSHALENVTNGDANIALGYTSGYALTTGGNNIDIGNPGVAEEASTIRLGNSSHVRTFIAGISGSVVTGALIQVNATGQLGTAPSSARFKEKIKPMDKTSEALFALAPVTFRYKKEVDSAGKGQFGLVAEDVEKVNPDLVVHDKEGKPYSVRYDQVNAMLLNEFLKAHCKMEEQQKQIDSLTTQLERQAALIEKVSAKLELTRAPQQTVADKE